MSDINHDFTREVVCPHCGYEHGDSWERRMTDGDQEDEICDRCGKRFTVSCHITVSYSTDKAPDEPEDEEEYRDEFVSDRDMGDKS